MSSLTSVDESPGKMYALAAVLMALATVAVGLRFLARRLMKCSVGWDDFLIVLAYVFTIATGICMLVATASGNLGQHTEFSIRGNPIVTHRTRVLLQSIFASQLTQTLAFGFTKLGVLLFYKRLLSGPVFNGFMWTMVAVTVSWIIGFFFANLLQCAPISKNWIGLGASSEFCIDTNQMYIAQAWSDVFTDVLILSLPIPSIWALHMPLSRKVAVSCLLLLGSLVVLAGIARLVVFYDVNRKINAGDADISYLLTPTMYWPMVEASLGIVGACLPLMRPIFKKVAQGDGLRKRTDQSSFWNLISRRSRESDKTSEGSAEERSLPFDGRIGNSNSEWMEEGKRPVV